MHVLSFHWGEQAHIATGPARGIMAMYHLPRVCRTLVPEFRVRPEMLRIFVRDLQLNSKELERLDLLVPAVKNIDEDR